MRRVAPHVARPVGVEVVDVVVREDDVALADVGRVLAAAYLRATDGEPAESDAVVAVVLPGVRSVEDLAVLHHQAGAVRPDRHEVVTHDPRVADRHIRCVDRDRPGDLAGVDHRARGRDRHGSRGRQRRARRHAYVGRIRHATRWLRGVAGGRGSRLPRRRLWRTRASTLGAAPAFTRVRSPAQLAPVSEPVAVGVPLAWVRVEAADLGAVAQAVSIRVRASRMGPQPQLPPVAQVVAVRVVAGGGGGSREMVLPFPAIGQPIVITIARRRSRSPSRRGTRTRPPAEPAISTSTFSPRAAAPLGLMQIEGQCHPFFPRRTCGPSETAAGNSHSDAAARTISPLLRTPEAPTGIEPVYTALQAAA